MKIIFRLQKLRENKSNQLTPPKFNPVTAKGHIPCAVDTKLFLLDFNWNFRFFARVINHMRLVRLTERILEISTASRWRTWPLNTINIINNIANYLTF